MKIRNKAFSLIRDTLSAQWHGPPKPQDPSLLPSWRFLKAVRPVVNIIGAIFGVATILAVIMLLLMGCVSPTDDATETPGVKVWLNEDPKCGAPPDRSIALDPATPCE